MTTRKTEAPGRPRVGIVGSYGGLNLGDEAILQGIVAQLRASTPTEITVFSRNAEDTRARHPVDRVLATRELSRDELRPEVERLDLLVVGGGGILFDGEAATFLREAVLAREAGVPVMFYAVSAGPLLDAEARRAVQESLESADAVTVRERGALKVLEEAGVHREIRVTADPALLLEPEPLPAQALLKEGLEHERRLVGFSVRERGPAAPDLEESDYHALLANVADFVVDRLEADVVFVPMEPGDRQESHAVVAQMANARHATVLRGEYSAGQALAIVGRFALAVGMRLHFLVFAALQKVPFVALPYAGKVSGFLDDLGLRMPPIRQVNAGRVIAHVDQSWDFRDELRERVEAALPGLHERARETNRIALGILARRAAVAR